MVKEILRGDIFLINFDPAKWSEQGRVRPALIIQNDISNQHSPLTIVAPITSKIYQKDYPTNVIINKKESNLDKDSTILLNQIRAIDKSRVIKKLGSLKKEIMSKVDLAINVSLGL